MKKEYIVLFMDLETDRDDNERDVIRFILNYEEDYKEKIEEVFEELKVVWGEYKEGYRTIYSMDRVNLTGLKEY